jgi:hypothetical protein
LQIESADDAKSVVRKYIIGTRSRHGKVASITIEDEPKGPDEKGVWVVKGTFVTEDGGKEDFTASVTSRGEVTMTPPATPKSGKVPSKFGR